jgi:hypothetical protein
VTPGPGDDRTLALRLRAQRLSGPPATGVGALVAALAAVQAQDPVAAALTLRARSRGLRLADVERARDEERTVVWTWVLRGTLQLVAAADVGWLLGLLGPLFAAAGRPRRLALGLDDELCERALVALRELLAETGPLTRAQLVERLAARGVVVDPRSQAPAHLVAYAALRAVVCRVGPSREPRYALLDDWLGARPRTLEPDAALAELARRYLAAHGPATPADLAAWSGAGLRRARRGFELIAGELRAVTTAAGPAWMVATAPRRAARARPVLLGHFDPYLLGWASRELVLDARFARRIQTGGGFIQPAVVVEGRVAGTWRRERRGDRLEIALEPFEPLPADVLGGLERDGADVGRFLGFRPADGRTSVRVD